MTILNLKFKVMSDAAQEILTLTLTLTPNPNPDMISHFYLLS